MLSITSLAKRRSCSLSGYFGDIIGSAGPVNFQYCDGVYLFGGLCIRFVLGINMVGYVESRPRSISGRGLSDGFSMSNCPWLCLLSPSSDLLPALVCHSSSDGKIVAFTCCLRFSNNGINSFRESSVLSVTSHAKRRSCSSLSDILVIVVVVMMI